MKPPSPPCGPPRALIAPRAEVAPSDQRITVPPSPATVASARTTAPDAMRRLCALSAPAHWPWRPPPTSTCPPPAAPEASRDRPSCSSMSGASTRTRPPTPPPAPAATAPGALEAIVAEVAPVAESGSRTHVVKLDLPQRPDLRSGQFARLAIPAGSAAILHVPASALILRGQLEYVMVAEDGVARLRLVRSGRRQGGRISITSGLNPGEKVVVAGLDGLRDGQPLEVRP